MSKELVSSIDIDAPAGTVWEILIDFAAFPTWNPFIVEAQGRVQVGERVSLRMQPVIGSAITLHPKVVELCSSSSPPLSRSPGSSNVSASPAH